MQRVRTSNLVPGMISAEDVYSYNNQLILPKGTELTDKIITRLEFYSVLAIKVEDKMASEVGSSVDESLDGASNETSFSSITENLSYSEKIKATTQFKEFKKNFVENTEALQGNLRKIVEDNAPINRLKFFDEFFL